jgi:hypothetical protein
MDDFVLHRFSFAQVAPSPDEVLDFLHSTDLEEEHPAVAFTKYILQQLSDIEGITGGYKILPVLDLAVVTGCLKTQGGELRPGRQVCGYIKEATQTALFLCTAGEDFTRLTNQLNEQGDIMEAYILDAIGSLTVENAMDRIQEQLQKEMALAGLNISNRYSAGYCNWPLTDQHVFFELIGKNPTSISLSESCLMTPRKSVSGLIGIGTNLKRHEYGCSICNNKNCIYRKIITR